MFHPHLSTGQTKTLRGVLPNSLIKEIKPTCKEPVLPSSGLGFTTTVAPLHSNMMSTCNSARVTTMIVELPLSCSIRTERATNVSPLHFTKAFGSPNREDAPAAKTMAGTPLAICSQILGDFTTDDHSLYLAASFIDLHYLSTTHQSSDWVFF